MTLATTINELFLTDGVFSYLIVVIIMVLLLAVTGLKRELIVLALPVTVLIGLLYLDAGMGWQFLLMILNSVFLLLEFAAQKRG